MQVLSNESTVVGSVCVNALVSNQCDFNVSILYM